MNRTPIHPGIILRDELEELELSSSRFAAIIDVPANRISQIANQKRGVTADTALRIAQYFGTTPDFWLNLQKMYDLDLARQKIGDSLSRIPQRATQSIPQE